jgi:hypothetical protein
MGFRERRGRNYGNVLEREMDGIVWKILEFS